MSITFDELQKYISQQSGIPINLITSSTRFVEDLGITGDDGYELIESVSNKYHVDLNNIEWSNSFGCEGCGPDIVNFFTSKVLSLFKKNSDKQSSISLQPPHTVGELLMVINDMKKIM